MGMTGGAVERLHCEICGCVMHGKAHYGSLVTCQRIIGLRAALATLQADFAAFKETALETSNHLHDVIRERDTLRTRVEAVLALHKPTLRGKHKVCEACGEDGSDAETPWPCPTRRALEGKP